MASDSVFRAFNADVFASSYAEARRKFLQAAEAFQLQVRQYAHPLQGPEAEALGTDAVWLGSIDAPNVLVMISATHGVEGFCGSGIQCDFLSILPDISDDTAVLVVHAINPHGFAWLRRVTEEGVDLNRNFVDFDAPLPENRGYDELEAAIIPGDLDNNTLAEADARLMAFERSHGRTAYEEALSSGQYLYPYGLFYGGTQPTWSRRTTEDIVRDYGLADRKRVAVIDLHTGLGPFGYGEPICDHPPESHGVRLARAWYGDSVTEPLLGTSSSVAKFGLSDFGWQQMVGDALVFIALEFGTYPVDDMMRALRSDHWLHRRGEPDWRDAQCRESKTAIKRHFYPGTMAWQEMVVFRARQVISQALKGLTAS